MALPKCAIPTCTVELSGGPVEVSGLTMGQARLMGGMKSETANVAAISWATNTDKADVEAWLEDTPAGDVRLLLAAITEASGLSEGARFPKRQGDDAVDDGEAES